MKIKKIFELFLTFFKIGLFTFGGGYAMLSLLEEEFIIKKKWLEEDEFFDMVGIAESTPGPIAINMATYIGYKTNKFWGSLFATLGVCLPSLIIIFIVSLFFDKIINNYYIAAAFKGIQVCVIFLIAKAGLKMLKQMKFNIFNIIVLSIVFICTIIFSLFAVSFSNLYFILLSAGISLLIFTIGNIKGKEE